METEYCLSSELCDNHLELVAKIRTQPWKIFNPLLQIPMNICNSEYKSADFLLPNKFWAMCRQPLDQLHLNVSWSSSRLHAHLESYFNGNQVPVPEPCNHNNVVISSIFSDTGLWNSRNLCNITLISAIFFQCNRSGCIQFTNYHKNDLIINKTSKNGQIVSFQTDKRRKLHKKVTKIRHRRWHRICQYVM